MTGPYTAGANRGLKRNSSTGDGPLRWSPSSHLASSHLVRLLRDLALIWLVETSRIAVLTTKGRCCLPCNDGTSTFSLFVPSAQYPDINARRVSVCDGR